MQRWSSQIRFPFRPLRYGLKADPLLPGIIKLILDDPKQSFIELEEGLYLGLMLGIQLFLLLDLLHAVINQFLYLGILAPELLHSLAIKRLSKINAIFKYFIILLDFG